MSFQSTYRSILKDYPDVLTVDDMSKALKISPKTCYKLLHDNKVVCIKVGRTYRIPKAHLLSYMRLAKPTSPFS